MYSNIYNILFFVIEFMKLFLCCTLFINIKIKYPKTLLYTFILIVFAILLSSVYVELSKYGLIYGIVSIATISFTTTSKCDIKYIILNYIFICLVDMIFSAIFMFLLKYTGNELQNNYFLNIVVNSISLIILLLLFLFIIKSRAEHKVQTYYSSTSSSLIFIFIVGGTALGLYIALVQYFGFNTLDNSYKRVVALVLSFSSLIFIIICIALIVTYSKNKHLTEVNIINNKLLASQEKYYKMLLDKNEETKKFRHDISKHIYCMHVLLKNEDYDELEQYISKINLTISELRTNINTGNKLIDAIVNDLSTKNPSTVINWKGNIPEDIAISNMDLCTIFGNVLSNAFEASNLINVHVKILETAIFIHITNPFEKEPVIMEDKIISSKKEKGHGYGMPNIISCVERNGGSFEYRTDDNIFIVEIIFPSLLG